MRFILAYALVMGLALGWTFGFYYGLGLGYTQGMNDTVHIYRRVLNPWQDP